MKNLEERTDSFATPAALSGILAGTALSYADDDCVRWIGYSLIVGSIIGRGIAYYLQNRKK